MSRPIVTGNSLPSWKPSIVMNVTSAHVDVVPLHVPVIVGDVVETAGRFQERHDRVPHRVFRRLVDIDGRIAQMVRAAAADGLHEFGRLDRLRPETDVMHIAAARQGREPLAQLADRFAQRTVAVAVRAQRGTRTPSSFRLRISANTSRPAAFLLASSSLRGASNTFVILDRPYRLGLQLPVPHQCIYNEIIDRHESFPGYVQRATGCLPLSAC